ncbi:unnamed protein product, partial [Laminaria digitata]
FFGSSVAISGPIAIVAAKGSDNDHGAVYLFDTTTGAQTAKLTGGDPAKKDFFGASVAISGTTAIVSTFEKSSASGEAYLFDTATGAQLAKLIPSIPAKKDYFGTSVAISGTTAIIGASGAGDNGLLNSGAAYLVHRQ